MSLAPRRLAVLFAPLVFGCSDQDPVEVVPGDPAPIVGDPLAGRVAFETECATCHASGDGIDLAFFGFSDTTIVRRAVAHVDTSTAHDIVAHVRTLPVPAVARDARLFQPGDRLLRSDEELAIELFGSDRWPEDLTTETLLRIDPLHTPAALALPLWSVEEGNTDWMPDVPLPDEVLDVEGSLPRSLIAGYREAPTEQNLVLATQVLRAVVRQRDRPGAPCVTQEPARANYELCFQIQRWISTLAGQHMIRFGLTGRLHPAIHDNWWDVGMTVRRAILLASMDVENAFENWASWMYLGWIFEPSRHASTYTAQGLANVGLPRHATFVALRSQVARPAASFAVYADLTTAARHAPVHWAGDAVTFGYRHVLERLGRGELPRPDRRAEARERIGAAFAIAARKLSEEERSALRTIADHTLEAFDDATGRDGRTTGGGG